MTEIRDLFHRDINQRVANEGVARVWDNTALAEELREYVVTESIERHLITFFAAFTDSMGLRKSGKGREGMAIWVSGFFGSGKSHFAKILGHLLGNEVVDPASGQRAIDLFQPHIDNGKQATELKGYLHQVATMAWTHPILLEIKSKENLSNPNSIAEICLTSFYQSLGFSATVYIARIEKMLTEHGAYQAFKDYYSATFNVSWEIGRGQHMFNRKRIAQGLRHCLPSEFPTADAADKALEDARKYENVTVEGFVEQLLEYTEKKRLEHPQLLPHIVFVLDEVQQFIGDDGKKIHELQTIVEHLGSKGKGQVWVIATGQEELDRVIDRTQIKLNELGRLTARFANRIHLTSEDVKRVVKDRLLTKRPTALPDLKSLYGSYEGFFADLIRLNTERQLPGVNESDFTAYYPFLPYQPSLAQDMFDTMRGIRISGSERSMLTVTQGILKQTAAQSVGSLVSFDLIFDEIESEVATSDYLGANGVRAIREADQRLEGWHVSPTRILKVLWLANRLTWIPSTVETITKMLVNATGEDIPALRVHVDETLEKLRRAGYIGYDAATKNYKYLSAEEGEVEKALIDKIGTFGTGTSLAIRKTKDFAKERIFTRQKASEFRAPYGKNGLFAFTLLVDGEEVAGSGEIKVECYGPLSTVKPDTLHKDNLAQGDKGKKIFWLAKPSSLLTERIKRLESLRWLTTDPSHTQGRSENYLKAVDEKRVEAQTLETFVVREIEEAFREGCLYFSGEERQLDGKKDIRAVIKDVFQTVGPNLYNRYDAADKDFDVKSVDKYLQPTQTKLDSISPHLDLFDSTGQLITHGPLVEGILDELKDREDDGRSLEGEEITSHFESIPFGWPNDLIRVVCAALLRGGAIVLNSDGKAIYDYTDAAASECLTKTTKFRKTKLLPIKTGLSPSQIQAAKNALIGLGLSNVQESTNDLARAVRQLATKFLADADRVRDAIKYGLPLPDTFKKAETACRPLEKEEDPTVVVTEFLKQEAVWTELKGFFDTFDGFVKEGKDDKFRASQQLAGICRENGPLQNTDQAGAVSKALADMDAILSGKTILEQWSSYQTNAEDLLTAYRTAYQAAYSAVRDAVTTIRTTVEGSPDWNALKTARQDAVTKAFFASGAKLGLEASLKTASLSDLISATQKYNLTTLDALKVALPNQRTDLLKAIQESLAEQAVEDGKPKPKIRRWSLNGQLAGKTFTSTDEVDAAFAALSDQVKKLLEDDHTVVMD